MALAVGLALAACGGKGYDALASVRQACSDMGYTDGTYTGADESDDAEWSSEDWTKLAVDLNKTANQVARAARDDGRWNRLSNAVTDFQAGAEQLAIVHDETLPQADRDAAQAKVDRVGPQRVVQVLDQECRKAQAE
ncbi:hypothetical protein OG407_20885 [Streptomyces sp. NBC_01515]|uniref:hypothetical protein n=1 Tax=Streptomyces sp. NBC_01515 TaxID=2903890 RepID=UPI00386C727A